MANIETFTVRLQENGRITIPEPIRAVLNLKESDLVKFSIEKIV